MAMTHAGHKGAAIRAMLFILLTALAVSILYPLFWMVISSFKTNRELFLNTWALPTTWQWSNYVLAWNAGVGRFFFNSVFVTTISTAAATLIGALAAYPLSRFDFPGRTAILLFIVGGLMLAPQISLISLYKLLQGLGIYNTYWAMIVPYVAYRIPFTVFLLWSYFLFLPREVEEAAYSDGCNSWGILWHVVLPMSKPIIATAALLSARVIWNEFMFALVFVEDSALRTIPIGLMGLKSQVDTDWTVLLAGLTMSAIPIILLFILMQKQFVRGLAEGGVKG
jgi:raffinose/stachyose/melibiose transport system permease protein